MIDPFKYAHEKEDEIIWMSQNTNELETTPMINLKIIEAIKKRKYNFYPYQQGLDGLKELLLGDLKIEEGFDALITNGAIEATYVLTRAMMHEGDNVIASDPSFLPIHHQIRLTGADIREIPVYKEPYRMTVDEINESVDEKTKFILLIDPLNPLGTSYPKNDVKAICQIAEDNNLWIIDDITYRDFAYEHTLTSKFLPERTFIIYSFSKNCGFAGMRLGALVMPKEMSTEIHRWRANPLSTNILAQIGAKIALETKSQWIGDMIKQSRKNQAIIKESVDRTPGTRLPVYPSNTNMFVIDIKETGIEPNELQEKLLMEHNIFVRAGNYVSATAGHNFIRVSFTVPEPQVRIFAEVFPKVIQEMRR